jgi:hypothetical protein
LIGGRVTGGRVTGGLIGGRVTGGRVTGGFIGGRMTGGRVIGGFTMGGRVIGGFTIGGSVIGGFTIGGRVIGGFTIGGRVTGGFTIGGRVTGGLMGGRIMGPLGVLPLGLCFLGGFPQYPHPRIGVTEEMKSMEMRRRAVNLEESIFWTREKMELENLGYRVLERIEVLYRSEGNGKWKRKEKKP